MQENKRKIVRIASQTNLHIFSTQIFVLTDYIRYLSTMELTTIFIYCMLSFYQTKDAIARDKCHVK